MTHLVTNLPSQPALHSLDIGLAPKTNPEFRRKTVLPLLQLTPLAREPSTRSSITRARTASMKCVNGVRRSLRGRRDEEEGSS